MYCVNGQAPYFMTLQEARWYAINGNHLDLNEMRVNGLYKALADIFDEDKNLVGTILSPPDDVLERQGNKAKKAGMLDTLYYIKGGTTVLRVLNPDGSLSDDFRLDYMVKNNRYRVPCVDGELPFVTIEEACEFLYRAYSSEHAMIDAGSPIMNSRGKIHAYVIKFDKNTVIYGSGRKWKEVLPNGRLGKAVKVRYGTTATNQGTFKTNWGRPLVLTKEPTSEKARDLCKEALALKNGHQEEE